MPHMLTRAQIERGLPPQGIAASLDAAALATGSVRECLLRPERVLRPAGHRLPAPHRSKVWATPEEWEAIAEVPFERGIIGPIEDSEVASFDGEIILNGALIRGREGPRPTDHPRGRLGGPGAQIDPEPHPFERVPALDRRRHRGASGLPSVVRHRARQGRPFSGAAPTGSASSTSFVYLRAGGGGWR